MHDRRSPWLLALLILQILCAGFFIFDGITDWLGLENSPSLRHVESFEIFMATALVASIGGTIWSIRHLQQRQKILDRQIAVAAGAFADVIEKHFAEWQLTDAEQDIAMMSIKGLSVGEMAQMRGSKDGTIKAHSAAVYRKAGVSGRHQLLAFFVEELLAEPLINTPQA